MNNLYEEILKEKRKIMKELDLVDDDIIYISGSLVEGIGNKYSDIDIFIITNDIKKIELTNYDYDETKLKTIFREFIGKKCDIEIYDIKTIEKNLSILNKVEIEKVRIANIFDEIPTNKFLSFLHRMLVGQVLNNEKSFENIRRKINKDKYYKVLSLYYQNEIENIYDDLVGNMENKNYITTILLGNTIIPSLMAYYLASKEVSIDRRKWSYIYLKRLAEKDKNVLNLLTEFEKFLFLKIEKEKYAKELLKFINKIIQ